jgi:two-component system, LuxR family, sensor kinase FixL
MDRSANLQNAVEDGDARFRALLDAAVDGIIAIDSEGKVVEFNPAACRLFGYSDEDILGRNVSVLMPEPDRSQHDGYLHSYLDTRERKIIGIGREVTGRRADGSTFPMHLSVGDAEGGRFIGIVRDLSAAKVAEAEGRQLQDRLAEVDRFNLMGEMAAGLAHEINQPLSAIATYAQAGKRFMAQDEVDMEALTEACEKISDQALRAGQIIQNLRSFVNNQAVRDDRLDLNKVVADVLNLIEADALAEGITVTTEFTQPMPNVAGDAVQLQQVLLNLARNAVDAMRGGLEKEQGIRISTGVVDDDKVRVEVFDHGHGVSKQLAESIFHPFVTTKREGLGVGLAVSRTIIQAHSGEIHYRANVDGGSVFGFTLPVAEEG